MTEDNLINDNPDTIKGLCEMYGISQTELSRQYGIPLRTVQDWYAGRRKPPSYVVGMLSDLLGYERVVVKRD